MPRLTPPSDHLSSHILLSDYSGRERGTDFLFACVRECESQTGKNWRRCGESWAQHRYSVERRAESHVSIALECHSPDAHRQIPINLRMSFVLLLFVCSWRMEKVIEAEKERDKTEHCRCRDFFPVFSRSSSIFGCCCLPVVRPTYFNFDRALRFFSAVRCCHFDVFYRQRHTGPCESHFCHVLLGAFCAEQKMFLCMYQTRIQLKSERHNWIIC